MNIALFLGVNNWAFRSDEMSASTVDPSSGNAGSTRVAVGTKPAKQVAELRDRLAEVRAAAMLERHAHFQGRSQWVVCRCSNRRLRLDGVLPSYYLKQLAQAALCDLEGVDCIDNCIVVANPDGIVEGSSASPVDTLSPDGRDPDPRRPR